MHNISISYFQTRLKTQSAVSHFSTHNLCKQNGCIEVIIVYRACLSHACYGAVLTTRMLVPSFGNNGFSFTSSRSCTCSDGALYVHVGMCVDYEDGGSMASVFLMVWFCHPMSLAMQALGNLHEGHFLYRLCGGCCRHGIGGVLHHIIHDCIKYQGVGM